MTEEDIKYRQGRRKEQVETSAVGALIGFGGMLIMLILLLLIA
tara:strand:+ start:1054 stop:1182 length:129 start_codon:yes stop_codon:yes gene_type:complete